MGISIFSYNGGVTVGLQVDAGLIADPDTIIADYEREVDMLRNLAPHHQSKRAARR
jgi:WS/DGAT C-terminal domain